MKIVKSFSDPDFFVKNYYLALTEEELSNGFWNWGLCDDGELYCQCSDFDEHNVRSLQTRSIKNDLDGSYWYPWYYVLNHYIEFSHMRKIVKEFGHLVVFT